MQKITPSLWFNNNAEEAISFYASIFKNFTVFDKSYYGASAPVPPGTLLSATFRLENQEFIAINAGPQFPFTPAVSFTIYCENQTEVDNYWDKLLEGGGKESQCGWLEDKFGLSWQVVPTMLPKMISDKDPEKADRALQAMMKMVKLDIATLEKAFNGK